MSGVVKNVIRMDDILDVFYNHDYPTKAEIKAVDELLDMVQKLYLKVEYIVLIDDKIAAVFTSRNFLEYVFDTETGELKEMDSEDESIEKWIQMYKSA